MAAAACLPMDENNKNPLKTITFSVGELMHKCADFGVKKIIVGLGGSCTNDFECGANGDMSGTYEQGVTAVVPINRLRQDFSISRLSSEVNLKCTVENVLRLLKIRIKC